MDHIVSANQAISIGETRLATRSRSQKQGSRINSSTGNDEELSLNALYLTVFFNFSSFDVVPCRVRNQPSDESAGFQSQITGGDSRPNTANVGISFGVKLAWKPITGSTTNAASVRLEIGSNGEVGRRITEVL